jgi:hypothetical protein
MIPPSMGSETLKDAMSIALNRTGEVLYGSLIAFLLGLLYLVLEKKKKKKFKHENKNDTNPTSKDNQE